MSSAGRRRCSPTSTTPGATCPGRTSTCPPSSSGGPRSAPTRRSSAAPRGGAMPSSAPAPSSPETSRTTRWSTATRRGCGAGCAPAASSSVWGSRPIPRRRPAARRARVAIAGRGSPSPKSSDRRRPVDHGHPDEDTDAPLAGAAPRPPGSVSRDRARGHGGAPRRLRAPAVHPRATRGRPRGGDRGLLRLSARRRHLVGDRRPPRAGSIGDVGCFSFFPSKNLGAFGDAGMCVTNDPALAERLKILRVHGSKPKYHHLIVGGNFRLDEVQAAVLLVKLKHLDGWTARRQANAGTYQTAFEEARLADRLGTPRVPAGYRHIFNQYVVRAERRDDLREHLRRAEIGTEIYYPVPLHLQECFASLGGTPEDCPVSVRAAKETLALPIYPELTAEQQRHVVRTIVEFYAPGH